MMKYNYKIGAYKERRGLRVSTLLIFFLIFLPILGYAGFLMALPGLGGWPVKPHDEVAQVVATIPPGDMGNRLFIPATNTILDLDSRDVSLTGNIGMEGASTIKADKFAFGVTPEHILRASPFYRLSQLHDGDEFYIDYNGTRYAYRVSSDVIKERHLLLQTSDSEVSVYAEPVGVVAWRDGEPRIETPAPAGMESTADIFADEAVE